MNFIQLLASGERDRFAIRRVNPKNRREKRKILVKILENPPTDVTD
jgi:hypothetical protein